ncbi:MAG: CHASE3 domain-containing protein [Planctomycetota bacterium]|nr:CHASE3 domain-containing protein [Planctomycetota bacterium]
MGTGMTFGKRLAIGFSLAGLTLLIIAFVGYQNIGQLIENEGWVSHTQQVRRVISDLQSAMVDAESGARGFVITGKDSFLEPYTAALSDIEKLQVQLRTLTADNPAQQQRIDALRPAIDAKLNVLKNNIALRRTETVESVAKVVSLGEGKEAMDQIRRLLNDMDAAESTLLEKRHILAESSASGSKQIILWGTLLGVAAVAAIGWFITTSLTRQIGSAVQHIQSSSSELQAAANQQATGAKEQSTSMSEISTTISELLATSRQITESAQRVSQIAEQTALSSRDGDQTVGRAQESVAQIRKQVDLIVNHMLDLGRKSQQIGGILEIINELSEQTNILAINATIEAAGAGEAGRRFGVVADEIRKLADRVGGSTKEIRTLIEEIRSAVNTTVMATESGSKSVDAGLSQFNAVAASFKQINGLVGTTTEAAREIVLSTKQQSTAVEQVNQAISTVAQTTKETEASTNQTLQTSSQLTSLSRELAQMVQPAGA